MVVAASRGGIPHQWGFSRLDSNPQFTHLIASNAALRFTHFLRRRSKLRILLRSSLQNLSSVDHVLQLKNGGLNILDRSYDVCSAACSSCLYFFSGKGNTNNYRGKVTSQLGSSRRNSSSGRNLTNTLLALNVLVYIAQIATKGRLILLGAKVNSLIDQGQLWRLISSSFLHANIGHLMINCYSLNSLGPAVEILTGRKRYIALYFASAIGSAAMSYWFSKSSSVGASGAIFGLTGAYAVFMLRHRNLLEGGTNGLQHIASVILLNMVLGGLSRGIDNWGHLGGLITGVVTSWFIGPAYKYETRDGKIGLVDRAPIRSLVTPKNTR